MSKTVWIGEKDAELLQVLHKQTGVEKKELVGVALMLLNSKLMENSGVVTELLRDRK